MDAQYIHLEAVRTSIQVITTVQKCRTNLLHWSRPAALSSGDPKRNIQGGWKTPACREVEALMAQVMAKR